MYDTYSYKIDYTEFMTIIVCVSSMSENTLFDPVIPYPYTPVTQVTKPIATELRPKIYPDRTPSN